MNDRREALLGRFRAGSLTRLRKLSLALIELGEGRGGEAVYKDVARELHTLKGEARMLGLEPVAAVAHAAEDLLQAARSGATTMAEATARMNASLDVVAAFMRGEPAGSPNGLAAAKAALANTPSAAASGSGAGAASTPAVEAGPGTGASPGAAPSASPGAGSGPSPGVGSAASATAGAGATPAAPAPSSADALPSGGALSPLGAALLTKPAPAAEESVPAAPMERWVQVNMARIDELCGHLSGFASEFRSFLSRLSNTLADGAAPTRAGIEQIGLREDLDRFRVNLEEITSAAWALRLVPVEPMLADLLRHAHQLGSSQNKRLRGVIQASGAEVERDILDSLHEPLLHLIRNAVDHGIEPPASRGSKPAEGLLTLEAEPLGAHVLISVGDDGRGLNPADIRAAAVAKRLLREETASTLSDSEVLELLFTPGFSTKNTISDLSGRGVGLDVVREVVEGLGGSVQIQSDPGKGTRFSLSVPARISKERLLVFRCAEALYAIPSRQVREIMQYALDIDTIAGGRVIRCRGEAIPLFSMASTLARGGSEDEPSVIVIETQNRRWAFSVSTILGEFELVRQPVDDIVAASGLVSASCVLDNGELVLVLTVAALTRKGSSRALPKMTSTTRKRVLAVDDSAVVRDLVEQVLSEAGFEVRLAHHGQNALEVLESYVPDLVVTDVEMPVMDGLELLRRIRERGQEPPVIILSSRGAPEDLEKASSLGADAYIVKSNFEATTLLKTVRSFSGSTS